MRTSGPCVVSGAAAESRDAGGTPCAAKETAALRCRGASTEKPCRDGTRSKPGFRAVEWAVPGSAEGQGAPG